MLIKEEEKKVISNKQQTYRGQKYEQKKDQKVVSKNKQNSLTYRENYKVKQMTDYNFAKNYENIKSWEFKKQVNLKPSQKIF